MPNPTQIQKFLSGIHYPTDKQTLVAAAEKNGADDEIMKTLKRLPDKRYEKPTAVTKAIGDLKRV
ncbi:MAG: DUF2795 domain-containing protein [Chloroflexi bacterium]|nr:DUF2795 domain-containing protein [Chloroflexota bacterium]